MLEKELCVVWKNVQIKASIMVSVYGMVPKSRNVVMMDARTVLYREESAVLMEQEGAEIANMKEEHVATKDVQQSPIIKVESAPSTRCVVTMDAQTRPRSGKEFAKSTGQI
mmetsp:Transcript_24414/g.52641  ORF Transcript_24414/g.52641 Transcript_24414/m.52641 type:complete len:111 (+) Transcript_24414:727-1059(+)